MTLPNFKFTLRTFRRHAGAYLFAIAVLAAGIGLTTAIFSLVKAVLLRPLPYANQNNVQVIWKKDTKANNPFIEMAYPELHDLQQNIPAFESVAVMPTTLYGYGKVIQTGTKDPVQVESAPVSHDFFRTLGVAPTIGRDFTDSDEHAGATPVVILSDHVWHENFDANPQIIGQQIRLNGTAHTIIGVMGPTVDFPRGAGLWVPLDIGTARANVYLQAIARVRPNTPPHQSQAQLNALFGRLALEYPQFYSPGQEAVVSSLTEYWTGSVRPQLYIALGASLLLLGMSCITASNLFLSRTFARAQEVATRASLGASSSQIASQFILDGVVAAGLAASTGLALAWALVKVLVLAAPPDIPRVEASHIDGDVLLFSAAIALIASLACTLTPVLAATRLSLETVLRENSGRLTATSRSRRWQNAFAAAQTAITVVLLSVALLIGVSVHEMLQTDTGFKHRDTLTMNLALRGNSPLSRHDFYSRLLALVRESAIIDDAAAVLVRPFEGAIGWDMPYRTEFEDPSKQQQPPVSNFEVVTPGYFRTVGTPLLEGRDFSDQDRDGAPQVAIVSHSLAERFRRDGHPPIGLQLRFGRGKTGKLWTIIGIAADTRYRGVNTRNDDIYVNHLQTNIPVNYLVIRGKGNRKDLTDLVRRQIAKLDPNQAIAGVATIEQLVDRNTARQRFSRTLLILFGFGALLLATAGVFGVVTESVAMRRREMAICTVLGASRRDLITRIAGRTLTYAMAGSAAGWLCSMALGRTLPPLLDAGTGASPWLTATVPIVLLTISAIAAILPAWDAAGQEPGTALSS